jgi:two-component system response regulator HydG
MNKILVIDDDRDICVLLQRYLKKKGFAVDIELSGKSGLNALKKSQHDLVICDFRLPDFNGLEMVAQLKSIQPNVAVIIITGYSDVQMAVNLIKKGAFEYVVKPIHPEEILLNINAALKQVSYQDSNPQFDKSKPAKSQPLKKSTNKGDDFIKGQSEQAKHIYSLVDMVAPTQMSVLIVGESGTGKEILARTIHNQSKRKNENFVAIDCGAIPNEIAGSELFGHKQGSFTGATQDKIGHFEVANNGTLFLDEVGNLSYENQVKLLRVLQERKIKRIGGTKEISLNIRILAATNENLKKSVEEGSFREDLYYRLNEFKIELPAVRNRKSDIEKFANFFLSSARSELDKPKVQFDNAVLNVFKKYPWPGNLREMKNVIKRATLLCQGDVIKIEQLPVEVKMGSEGEMFQTNLAQVDESNLDLKTIVERAERKAILSALMNTDFNKSKAARLLKVDRKTLYNKITAYEIDMPK